MIKQNYENIEIKSRLEEALQINQNQKEVQHEVYRKMVNLKGH